MNPFRSSDCSDHPTEPAASASGSSSTRRTRASWGAGVWLLFVMAATAVPYFRSLQYGFVYDDEVQIVNNEAIRSWRAVPSYFHTSIGDLFEPGTSNNAYYRPLFVLFLRVNHALFGLNPVGWHLAALCVHLVVTALLFFLLRLHFRNPWIAAAGALLFGLHPVHIENVVWVSGITDGLAAVGILGSLLLWIRSRESPRAGLRLGALSLYAAALLTKETAIVFPAVLFVYSLTVKHSNGNDEKNAPKRFIGSVREILPFVAATMLYLALRFLVLPAPSSPSSWISRQDVILTAPSLILFYLRQLVWPRGLSLYYDVPILSAATVETLALPLVVLLGLIACGWAIWRVSRDAAVSAAMIWFAAPLLPVLQIGLFRRDDFAHDRYLYLPSVGLALATAFLLSKVVTQETKSHVRFLVTAAVLLLLAGLGISTAVQSAPWRDNLSLYSHAVQRSPSNLMAWNNLAVQYVERGRLEEAGRIFEAILADRPDFWLANYNYGNLSYRLQRYDRAEQYLHRAIALNPRDADAYVYLGLTYLRENRLQEAAAKFRDAIARKPEGEGLHLALGVILLQQGDREGARTEFVTELKYHPESAAARTQWGLLESQLEHSEK